jgi:replicative DNA helicase
MGKTAFLLNNLKYAALEGYRPGIISLEMGRNALGTRLMLAEAGIDNQRAMQGKLSEDELKRVNDAAIKLMDLGMVIDDTATLTPALLRIKARMMQQIHKIDLLAIDYLQLMRSDGNNQNRNREQEVAEISRTCKLLAKEMNIPVLALAQLSREPDKRRGWSTRPQLSDLRESGAIEQDSNVVIFLYRPEYYALDTYPDGPDQGMNTDGITEVIIAKHREGPTGMKKIFFRKDAGSFENLSRQKQTSTPLAPEPDENDPWWQK